ncbi:MAG: VWA domain-containing protein, partial [Planctomycetes bacterium]|nr:VWA domain-containing protein [Planctomycetota bacterium]
MTFGTAIFLWAALAGLVPIVLHMINRQNAPVVYFSTLRFLRLSVQRTRRRKRVHDLLLLLLRVAALVLIAVALARPALRWLHRWVGGESSTAVVLIVDNSSSLATRDQNGPRWDRVSSATLQILDQLQDGDQVALLVTNGPSPPSARGLLRNHEVVRQAFRGCQPSFERADLVGTLVEARRLLRTAPAQNREIYVVTDMQACCWNDLQRLASDTQGGAEDSPIVVVDTRGPRLPNAALGSIVAQATAPVAGVPLRVTVGVQGDAEVSEERHVSVYIDGQKHDTSPTLRIEPVQVVPHTFDIALGGKRLHRGQLQLEGDDACSA